MISATSTLPNVLNIFDGNLPHHKDPKFFRFYENIYEMWLRRGVGTPYGKSCICQWEIRLIVDYTCSLCAQFNHFVMLLTTTLQLSWSFQSRLCIWWCPGVSFMFQVCPRSHINLYSCVHRTLWSLLFLVWQVWHVALVSSQGEMFL